MTYNYHTHTFRCHHASGTPEEYILRAITGGIKRMGFSDHIPLRFSDGFESKFRVCVDEGKAYCQEIKALAEKYRDQIEIKVGFEMEYYPALFDEMLKNALEYGAEYLILGQHFYAPENLGGQHTTKADENAEHLQEYVATVIEGMEKGVFTYIAHPDVFNFIGDAELYRRQMRKLCIAARERNVPLEINFLGIRQGRGYPDPVFWQIAGEEKAPVTFGFDAHEAESAFDAVSLEKAEEMVKKYNLNYIGEPELILIKEKQK